jgi:hypothetical protein
VGGSGGADTSGGEGNAGGNGGCATTAPVALFVVAPPVEPTGSAFDFDASTSSDPDQSTSSLSFDWDWESDGLYDASGMLITQNFAVPGVYPVTLRVTDASGLVSLAREEISVVAPSDLLTVTTATDEKDAGATPETPGGSGFSLREASAYANTVAGKQTILVPAGMTIQPSAETLSLGDAEGMDVFGYGATIDGSVVHLSCVSVVGNNTRVIGLEIRDCTFNTWGITGTNNQMIRCVVQNSAPLEIGGTGNTLGPGNVITRTMVMLISQQNAVIGNTIVDAAQFAIQAVYNPTQGSVIRGNLVLRPSGNGISAQSQGTIVAHNTVHGAGGTAIVVGSGISIVLVNNVMSQATSYGLEALDNQFLQRSNNAYFGNLLGACSNCALEASAMTLDPQFTNPAADDFRPGPLSPLVDAGLDLGYDLNGVRPGLYDGLGPDIGYFEAH